MWQKYGCTVEELKNGSQNARFSSIEGRHENLRSNDDVLSLRIEKIQTIDYFTNDFFATFPHTQNLVIHKASLRYLMRGDFSMAYNLMNVHITNTELIDLEDLAFSGTKILKTLNLRQNRIERIAENAFKGLMTLKFLTLSYNKVQSLHVNVFKDLRFLEQLSLGANRIRHVDENLFSKNRNLEVLFLNNNYLRTINGNLFAKNEKLREIYMENNDIKHISNIPNFLVNLKNLQIAVFYKNLCVDTMFIVMNGLYPPYDAIFGNCTALWKMWKEIQRNKIMQMHFTNFFLPACRIFNVHKCVEWCNETSSKPQLYKLINFFYLF